MLTVYQAQKELFEKIEIWIKKWKFEFGGIDAQIGEGKVQYVHLIFGRNRKELEK